MTTHIFRSQATFHRAGLLLGLVPGDQVVEWAGRVLSRESVPPLELVDVALTPPGDLTAMRAALQSLADDRESPAIVEALLDLAEGDVSAGRRSIGDTMTVLRQMDHLLAVVPDVAASIDAFADDYMLAVAGVTGDPEQIGAAMHAWLRRFAGAAEPFLGGES